MYLDTDIILALVKKTDWLKPHINLKALTDIKTSTFTVIEAELVIQREYGRDFIKDVLETVRNSKIKLLPLTEKVIEKSKELLSKHENLNIFDSVHAAFCIIENDTLISTDNIFPKISGLKYMDPRDL